MEEVNGSRGYGVDNMSAPHQYSTTPEVFCKKCGCSFPSTKENKHYCTSCTTKLKNQPIPLWIKGAGLLIVLLLAFSTLQLPSDLKDYKSLQGAIDTYQSAHYDESSVQFEALAAKYPKSKEVAGWLYISYIKSGKFDEAIIAADRLPDTLTSLSYPLQKELKVLLGLD